MKISVPTFASKSTTVKSDPIEIKQLKIEPIAERDCYRYLDIDKNIFYNTVLNKE